MAPSSFSLLLRHLSATHRRRHNHHYPLLRRLYSDTSPPPPTPSTSSLSARLSFVFDKIDEIEKDRSHQDDALHRIRAWRQSKHLRQPPPPPSPPENTNNHTNHEELGLGFSGGNDVVVSEGENKREIEVAHPWPEWVALMERLLKQNYFDNRRVDEDKMIKGLGEVDDHDDDDNNNVRKLKEGNEDVVDFTRDWNSVQLAMVNFGKDRFDIFRSLSRQDIQVLVGYGCPSADKKVVFSSKLLRKHAHLDEGDVCSSCSLRNTCVRAYLVTNKEDEPRTIDVMRVLLTYGFNPISGTVQNKSLLKQKTVKAVVRKLLREVVRLSAVPIDPNLPPPLIKKRLPKVKQPPPTPKRRVGRDNIEMKKGDWLCPKCNFMNFSKNSVCLQCDAKRPKRQLLPGEWECPECDFLNYRRNMSCFNCEHKRPPDGYMEEQAQLRQNRPPAKRERVPDREQVSNAWNFDFDDDESDGADVAAFEYADPHAMNEDHRLDSPPDENFGRSQEDYRAGRTSRFLGKEHSRPAETKHSVGFDDFDDEDDDIDNYEVDNQNRNERQEASAVNFSDVENEGYSESENDDDVVRFSGRNSRSFPKSSKALRHKGASSDTGDDDLDYVSDKDLPVHPKWKSSHVADSGLRDRASRGPSKRRRNFDEDDDDSLVFGNDNYRDKGFAHKQGRGNFQNSDKEGFRGADDDRRGYGNDKNRDKGFSQKQGRGRGNFRDSDTKGFREVNGPDDGYISRQSRGNFRDSDESRYSQDDELNRNRGRGGFRGQPDDRSVNTNRGRGGRGGSGLGHRGSFDNGHGRGSGRSQRESYDGGNGRGSGHSQRESYDGGNGRGSDRSQKGSFDRGMQKSNRPRQRGAGDRGHRRSDQTDDWSDRDSDRPLRQRRNVR